MELTFCKNDEGEKKRIIFKRIFEFLGRKIKHMLRKTEAEKQVWNMRTVI